MFKKTALTVAMSLWVASPAYALRYVITDMGKVPFNWDYAIKAINGKGQIIGIGNDGPQREKYLFLSEKRTTRRVLKLNEYYNVLQYENQFDDNFSFLSFVKGFTDDGNVYLNLPALRGLHGFYSRNDLLGYWPGMSEPNQIINVNTGALSTVASSGECTEPSFSCPVNYIGVSGVNQLIGSTPIVKRYEKTIIGGVSASGLVSKILYCEYAATCTLSTAGGIVENKHYFMKNEYFSNGPLDVPIQYRREYWIPLYFDFNNLSRLSENIVFIDSNDKGDVIGVDGWVNRPFVIYGGVFNYIEWPERDLPPFAINNNGDILGRTSSGSVLIRDGIYSEVACPVVDFNNKGEILCSNAVVLNGKIIATQKMLGLANSTINLVKINDKGQIAAHGKLIDGSHIFLLTPTPALPKSLGGNNCDSSCQPKLIADPINVGTGNKFEAETDYRLNSASPLSVSRYYNSLDGSEQWWRFGYSRKLLLTSDTVVDALRDDGKQLSFTLQNGVWQGDGDVNSRLTATANGWQYQTGLDEVEQYNAQGQLLSITGRNGLSLQLAYDNLGRLSSVTNAFGQVLRYAYQGDGKQVVAVTVPSGAVYRYQYDTQANLLKVIYPDQTQRQFVYENTDYPHALTGILDEKGVRYATDQYDAEGNDIANELAGGVNKTQISYAMNGANVTATVTQPQGLVSTSKLTEVNQMPLETERSENGRSATSQYDANGNITQQTDLNGVTTTYTYDTARNLQTSRTEAVGRPEARTFTTSWHPQFRLPTQIVEPKRTTSFSYDSKGNLLQKTVTANGQSRSWSYSYDANSLLLSEDGPRTDVNDITRYQYDSLGRLTSISNALNQTSRINSYNADGQPLSVTDANGLTSQLRYDLRGRLLSIQAGATETTQYQYDAAGLLTKLIRPDGSFLSYRYDDAHRLIGVNDALGNRIDYTLDAAGNRIKTEVHDPRNVLTQTQSQEFDQLNRLIKAVGGQNQATTYGYDSNGNPTAITDPLNRKTTLSYDALNRLVTLNEPGNRYTQTSYDPQDNVVSVRDPKYLNTSYNVDGFDQALTTTSPDTGVTRNTYDSAGNLTSTTDARNLTQTLRYDALNRLTQQQLPDQLATQFVYDQGTTAAGRLTSMTENGGATATRWNYDVYGRVIGKTFKTGTLNLAVTYQYDAAGQRTAITYPSGKTVNYSYAQGLVNAISSNGNSLLSQIQYQPFGDVKSALYGNGVTSARSFDADGRLLAFDLGENRSRQLSYDAAGQITAYRDGNPSFDRSFSYDVAGRLIADTDASKQIQFGYDANGNRSQLISGQTDHYQTVYNSNRLNGIVRYSPYYQPQKTYSYDAAGHMTSDGYTTFSYDSRGRLVKAANVAIGNEQYRINGLGQRVAKVTGTAPDLSGDANQDGTLDATDLRLIVLMAQGSRTVDLAADCNHDNQVTTADASCAQAKLADMKVNPGKYVQAGRYFMYDEAGHLLGEYAANGQAIQETVWLGDKPVAVLVGNSRYYIYTDQLNTPRAISDQNGKVVWRWDSDAFGSTPAQEDPDNDGIAFNYNLRFPGQYYDRSTGLHYNGFRDYNPAIGRYIQSDPIGLAGGVNTYGYTLNNPISYFDKTGLDVIVFSDSGHYLVGIETPYGLDTYGFGPNWKLEHSLRNIIAAGTIGVKGEINKNTGYANMSQQAQVVRTVDYSLKAGAILANKLDKRIQKDSSDYSLSYYHCLSFANGIANEAEGINRSSASVVADEFLNAPIISAIVILGMDQPLTEYRDRLYQIWNGRNQKNQ